MKGDAMAVSDRNWGEYCVALRKQMFMAEKFETTVKIEEIHVQSGTTVPLIDLRKPAYWKAGRSGKRSWDGAEKNGIEVDFAVADDGCVHFVTFSLDESRRGTLERFIERRQKQ